MAAASTVAMVDELDKRWLGRHDEDKGVYEFIFYDETDSSQRRVCVDRKIPLIKTCRLKGTCFGSCYRLCFGRSGTPGELWPCLIEKAFAKLYGSYGILDSGHTAIGMANLVRGVPCFFAFGPHFLPSSPDELWRQLVLLWNEGYLLAICWRKAVSGLIKGHAYGILGLFKAAAALGVCARLIKLRNPYGRTEWTGPWSDHSEELRNRPHVLREAGVEARDDGVFLMCVDDVVRHGLLLEGVRCLSRRHPSITP